VLDSLEDLTARTRAVARSPQLPDHSDARSAAHHLARLTSEIISEVAEHQAAPAAS
jgi:hypothetical protein